MKELAWFATSFLLVSQFAHAGGAEGNGAISLAAMVAEHSPHLSHSEKALLDTSSIVSRRLPMRLARSS